MGTIKELRWWAYKILPLAYDDSLSYYEVLAKATQKLNEVIDTTNKLPEAISEEIGKQLSGDDTDIYNNLFGGIIDAIATKEADELSYTPNEKHGGEIIWIGDTLYEVVVPMAIGTNYVVGSNIIPVDIDGELEKIKGYICTHNEFFHERATQNHDTQTYLYWKDKLYRVDADIRVNDIISERSTHNGVTTGQLTLVNTMDEITAHYIEMHESDNNLQTQIDGNDEDIKNLNKEDENLQRQITDNNNYQTTRINNIVSQAGNDNTEIVDARLGCLRQGQIKYDSLGEAIRKQIDLASNEGFRLETVKGQTIYFPFETVVGRCFVVTAETPISGSLITFSGSAEKQKDRYRYANNVKDLRGIYYGSSYANVMGIYSESEATTFTVLTVEDWLFNSYETQHIEETIYIRTPALEPITFISAGGTSKISVNNVSFEVNGIYEYQVNQYINTVSINTDNRLRIRLGKYDAGTRTFGKNENFHGEYNTNDRNPITILIGSSNTQNSATIKINNETLATNAQGRFVYYPNTDHTSIDIISKKDVALPLKLNIYQNLNQYSDSFRGGEKGKALSGCFILQTGSEHSDRISKFIQKGEDIPSNLGAIYEATSIKIASSNSPDMYKNIANVVLTGDCRAFLERLTRSTSSIDITLLPGDYHLMSVDTDNYTCLGGIESQGGYGHAINITIHGITTARTSDSLGTNIIIDKSCSDYSNNHPVTIIGYNTYGIDNMERVNTNFTLKNFNILGYDCNHPITYIDTTPCQTTIIENVNIHSWYKKINTYDAFDTTPNKECVGIRVGRGSNYGILNYVKHLNIWYCYKGLVCNGEHFIFEDVKMHHNIYGFYMGDKKTVGNMEHPNIFMGCSIEGCKYLGALDDINDNKLNKTLIMIGTSTELRWDIPIKERTSESVTWELTKPIQTLQNVYRGRIEIDEQEKPIVADPCYFDCTWYNGNTTYHSKSNNYHEI